MCADLLTHMGNTSFMTSWTSPSLLNEKTRWDENFCLTQTIAACNCTGLCSKMITQLTSTLTIYPRKGLCVAPKATVMQSFDFDRAND